MSKPDDTPESAVAPRPGGKPNLMGSIESANPPALGPGNNLRMLVELESAARPVERSTGARSSLWVVAVMALVVAGGSGWWWTTQRDGRLTASLESPVALATADTPAFPVEPVARATPVPTPEPITARIEPVVKATAANAPASVLVPDTATKLVEPAFPSGPLASLTQPTAPSVVRAMGDKPTVEKSPKPPAPATARTAKASVASTAKPVAAAAPAPAARFASGTPSGRTAGADGAATSRTAPDADPTKDADIVLLSALLEHMARDGQSGPLGPQTQTTIAQIVQRCDALGGKDSRESRECRRRICDGYWGKAQACPVRLAPKKS